MESLLKENQAKDAKWTEIQAYQREYKRFPYNKLFARVLAVDCNRNGSYEKVIKPENKKNIIFGFS